jgi:2'-5' RNA ligase
MSRLYFVAIVPPHEVCERITIIKKDFRDRFNSKHALKLMPHITLKAPFSVNDDRQVLGWFNNIPVTISAFEQKLTNFNCFANKRNPVIFIEPELSNELKQLQHTIIQDFKQHFPSIPIPQNEFSFHPHITVGYRDLGFENFQLAWREYQSKNFAASFSVENFYLLQHDRKQWHILENRRLL